jgi:uncharacterized protein (TIGR03083 family)
MKYSPEEQAVAYTGVRSRISTLLNESDADVNIPSCPDWSVQNLCAHLAGVAVALVNRDRPGADLQAWIDGHISSRTDRSIESLLDEWDSSGFEDLIRARPEGYGGLLYDVAAHEHDLRGALGRPGGRSTDAIDVCLEIQQQMLRADMAKKELTGSLTLRTPTATIQAGNGGTGLLLELDGPDANWEVFRIVGSRRSIGQLRALSWQGDLDPLLPALEHLPLPTSDLIE